MSARRAPSLYGRLSLVLTVLIAVMMTIGAGVWMRETRQAIHEEVEAATRVAEQWLKVLIPETLADAGAAGPAARERLMSHLAAVGRIRANRLEVFAADGQRLYVSPESPYKAGRHAPEWFAGWIAPEVTERQLEADGLSVVLTPDTSRAVLDAWDHLGAALGWAIALLLGIGLATRFAIGRALAPIGDIHNALERGASGRFDQRLPEYATRELALVARSYNRLADSLDESLAANARLEQDQALARALQLRLEQERRAVARELHDELGQGITAVRAIAGAIIQRSTDRPGLNGSAQAILAMTTQMQDGVHAILQRLRSRASDSQVRIEEVLESYCALWASHHGDIDIRCTIEPLDGAVTDALGLTILRMVQESLTNVARHAHATRVEVRLGVRDGGIEVEVIDNGRGLGENPAPDRHGLLGMRERIVELHGELELCSPAGGGLNVRARLPLPAAVPTSLSHPPAS
ncbi:MAG: HAMP domain-containing protein [Thauera sp.]|nr:HAMP domain-containing protein [Thauera sp.]MBP8922201.1 HAMP domain-containing protein [Thauera sp.]